MEEFQGYFYIIPAELAEAGNPTKAMLYGLITSLCRKNGACTASNSYLATKLHRKDPDTIRKWLGELQKEHWIEVEVDKEAGNKQTITLDPYRKKSVRLPEKIGKPLPKKIGISNINKVVEKSNKKTSAIASVLSDKKLQGKVQTGASYKADGQPPRKARVTRTPAQVEAFDKLLVADPFITYYREQAYAIHGLNYLHRSEYLNKKVRKQFDSAISKFGEELYQFIDWALDKGGEWCQYEPETVLTMRMFQRYENRDAAPATKKGKFKSRAQWDKEQKEKGL